MSGKNRCDSKPCAGGCPCSKAGTLCDSACHMGNLGNQYCAVFSVVCLFTFFLTVDQKFLKITKSFLSRTNKFSKKRALDFSIQCIHFEKKVDKQTKEKTAQCLRQKISKTQMKRPIISQNIYTFPTQQKIQNLKSSSGVTMAGFGKNRPKSF